MQSRALFQLITFASLPHCGMALASNNYSALLDLPLRELLEIQVSIATLSQQDGVINTPVFRGRINSPVDYEIVGTAQDLAFFNFSPTPQPMAGSIGISEIIPAPFWLAELLVG